MAPVWGPLFTTYVYEPQILTAEELEMLEPLLHAGSQSLLDLLHDKVSHPEKATMDMKTFLLTVRRVQERPNEHMLALYNTVVQQLDMVDKSISHLSTFFRLCFVSGQSG